MMQTRSNSSFLPYLAPTIFLVIFGFGITVAAVLYLTPTVWARWLLFFGGMLGLTGVALPVTWFLNLRFPSDPPAGPQVILRQAIWVGVYGVVLTWLQQVRLVSVWTGIGLALGLIAIEYLIRMREKARWQPRSVPDQEQPVENKPASQA
jgi:hypothetical protein